MPNHSVNSSCSNQEESSATSEGIVALGKRLVDELELDDSVDTLGRWMAHYIAEKIKAAEAADEQTQDKKMSECCDEILKLWSHRRDFDRANRPLDSFEPIFRALDSLDPESSTNRFFKKVDDENECEETRQWLRSASDVDEAARHVVNFCLSKAAKTALDKEQEWVRLASKTSVNDEDFRAIAKLLGTKDYATKHKKELIEKLEQLSSLSRSAITALQTGKKQPAQKAKAKSRVKK